MAWILAFLLVFAAIVALRLLDGTSWHTALWSALWGALAACAGGWLCHVFHQLLSWRPGRPRDAAPSADAGRPE